MKKENLVLLGIIFLIGCNSFISPSRISQSRVSNRKEVWFTPNHGSRDFLDMFTQPEKWADARSKITVFKLYDNQGRSGDCTFCGNNNFDNLVGIVPGGAFKWLNDHGIKIAFEAGSVKGFNCGRDPDTYDTMRSINSVNSSGGRVSYIAMDEPFFSGLPAQYNFAQGLGQCGYTVQETARRIKPYVDHVRSTGVEVGLIEPYPYFSVEQIKSFIAALEAEGVRLSFLHLDYDRIPGGSDTDHDLREIQSFCRQYNIDFGIIIIGSDANSSSGAVNTALNMAVRINSAIGLNSQDHILFQSWLAIPSGNTELKLYPNNIPEDDPSTMTALVNASLAMAR